MFKGIKTLDDFQLKGKAVLLRVDLNTAISGKRVEDSDRFKEHASTIKELKKKKARVVVLAHQSRPGKKDCTSLKQHAKILSKYTKVGFVPDTLGKKALTAIRSLKPAQALLLENVRFLKEEFKPSKTNKLVKVLAPEFDLYLDDAFSVSHRAHTSLVSFPKVLPSGMGRVMEHELRHLEKVSIKKGLFILGGAKPEEHIILLKSLSSNSKILTCGLFGQVATIGKGKDLGAQNLYLKEQLKQLPKLKPFLKRLETPLDFVVNAKGKRKVLDLEQFPSEFEIFDIGPKTIKKYTKEIKKAKTIFMKGTCGYCEELRFSKGTKAVLSSIQKSRSTSVIGGGHLSAALKKLKINKKKFSLVSLSGGALVDYVAGKELPGVEALKR